MQEEPTGPSEKVTVYGGSCSAAERPRFATIVWDPLVGVLKIGDQDEPVAKQEPRDDI